MAESDSNEKATPPAPAQGGAATDASGQVFRVRKVYLKDVSFESPLSPQVFASDQNWRPQVGLQLNTEMKQLDNDLVETVLNVQVTVKSKALMTETRLACLTCIAPICFSPSPAKK